MKGRWLQPSYAQKVNTEEYVCAFEWKKERLRLKKGKKNKDITREKNLIMFLSF